MDFLPEELVGGHGPVQRLRLEVQEIQYLTVPYETSIKLHGHANWQWEVWILPKKRVAYICMEGKKHAFVNLSNECIYLVAVKGKGGSYEEICGFFQKLNIQVQESSIVLET